MERIPRVVFWVVMVSLMSWNARSAQEEEQATRSSMRPYVYGNAAFGRCNHDFAIFGGGGGAEVFPTRRLGLGVDLGYYQFVDDTSFGLYSFNAALHFSDQSETSRADPYVSISPGFYNSGGSGYGGALGFGGGLNYWFGDRVGLHTDVRFAILGTEEGIALFRIGIAFR